MGDWLKKVARMISQKGGIFMFLRAQLSAQMATIADFLVTILLVRLFDVYYVYATLAGKGTRDAARMQRREEGHGNLLSRRGCSPDPSEGQKKHAGSGCCGTIS